jgi:cell division transport system ATP-binding protein
MNGRQGRSAIIRMFHVQKLYGAAPALSDVTLDIYEKEFLFVSAPSGAGKTTLLKLLYLGEAATSGQIIVDGMNLERIPHDRIALLRRKLGIIFQDFKLIPTKTVYDNVAIVLEAAGKKPRLIQKRVTGVLGVVGMQEKQNAYPQTLSGGEQQRVAVARAIVGDPKIILADEPTGSLDEAAANHIMGLLKWFHQRGATIVVATHNKELIRNTGGRVIRLEKGRVVDTEDLHRDPGGEADSLPRTEHR